MQHVGALFLLKEGVTYACYFFDCDPEFRTFPVSLWILLTYVSGVGDLANAKFIPELAAFKEPDMDLSVSGKTVTIVWDAMLNYVVYWVNIHGLSPFWGIFTTTLCGVFLFWGVFVAYWVGHVKHVIGRILGRDRNKCRVNLNFRI